MTDGIRRVEFDGTFGGWRDAARILLHDGVVPSHVEWVCSGAGGRDQQPALGLVTGCASAPPTERAPDGRLTVSRRFLELAEHVACHREAERWHLLYSALVRITGSTPHLLELSTDADVSRLLTMERAVRRAAHKMKAFVRFRVLQPHNEGAAAEPVYVAWFEPAHPVVALTAPFFVRRFPGMRWSILTPDRCAHWDRTQLHLTPGTGRSEAPDGDALESLWRAYYANTFNPARLRVRMMQSEMPKQYWHLLPEAPLIEELVRTAPARVHEMIAQVTAAPEAIPAADAAAGSVGAIPTRGPVRAIAGAPSRRAPRHPRADSAEFTPRALERPGGWDPVHDPGTAASCARAARVESRVVAHAATGVRIGRAHVTAGVAGWTDPTILQGGVFYPRGANSAELRLRHYASRFGMVEADATYYALPARDTTMRWAERTPGGFCFDVKAHALMTGHPAEVARLPEWIARTLPASLRAARHIYARHLAPALIDRVWDEFLAALEPLQSAGKLGAVFLQYPRWFTPARSAAAELATARARLGGIAGAVEFRNRAWLEGALSRRTPALLERLGLAYVAVDAPQGMQSSMPPDMAVTAPSLAVIRLHGRRTATWERHNSRVTERYRYLYDRDELASWVPRIIDVAKQHQRVHVVFNNNHANYATTNALELMDQLLDATGQG